MYERSALQSEYDGHYEYITQGAIIRSRVNWYELGEKNNKYFFNLENSKKKNSTIRKSVTTDDKCTTEPKQIMTEIHNFYANLYDKDSRSIPSDEFLKGINSKMLTDEQARKVRYQNNHN